MGVPHTEQSAFDSGGDLKYFRHLRKIANPKLEKYAIRAGAVCYAQTMRKTKERD